MFWRNDKKQVNGDKRCIKTFLRVVKMSEMMAFGMFCQTMISWYKILNSWITRYKLA
jgi:hypothetical protein